MAKCLCGCGEEIDSSNSRGEQKLFVSNVHQQRVYRRRRKQLAQGKQDAMLALDPAIPNRVRYEEKESEHIQKHLKRASQVGLPATLTLEQWLTTLDYFGWKCAYCQKAFYECLEHFVPLGLGGGTTVTNCVPACDNCNSRKRNYNPNWEEAKTGMWDALVRVRQYLHACTMTSETIKPILRWPGSKWSKATWIISHFPKHHVYVEPYAGSAACFFQKNRSNHEVLNDMNKDLIHMFRVLRSQSYDLASQVEMTPWARNEYEVSYEVCEDDLERARRFLVRCWQAHGSRVNNRSGWRHRGPSSGGSTTSLWNQLPAQLLAAAHRLQMAEIECKPALDLIKEYNTPDTLLYVDPPYVLETRNGPMYEHEMSNDEHRALLATLNEHVGPVVLSGYAHPLYDEMLAGWQCVTMPSLAEKGKIRTECLWLNAKAQRRQLNLFEVEGA